MSVPLLIGSFTSPTDFKKQVANYERLLRLRAKLNAENEAYSFQIEENMAGIPNAPQPFQSLSAQTTDRFALTQQATTDLVPYMGTESASFVLIYLTTIDELQLFVLNFPQFETRYLVGRQNLSSSEVNTAWEQFKSTLATQAQVGKRTDLNLSVDKEEVPTLEGELRPIPQGSTKRPPSVEEIEQLFLTSTSWKNFKSRFKNQKYSGGPIVAIKTLYRETVEEVVPRFLNSGELIYKAIKDHIAETQQTMSRSQRQRAR